MDGRAEERPRRAGAGSIPHEADLLRAAVEGGLDGMVVVSSDGVMITYNRKFQEIWPIPAEIVASGNDDAALASVLDKLADPDAFLQRVRGLYAQAAGTARDELLLLDGRVLDRYGTALRGPGGDYIGWAWYFRDVTAERAAAVDAERLRALVAVAQELADAHSEFDVLTVVSGRGASVLGAQGAAMCLLEPDGAHVRILGTTFFDEGLRADVATLPVSAPLPIVHAAVTGEPLFLVDRAAGVELFPGALEVYVRARTEATAAVPLTVHGRTIGSLAIAFEQRKAWLVADKVLLSALAALTALALDRLAAQAAEQEAGRQIRRLSESLQRSLLTALPQSEGLRITARYLPAAHGAEVGGDWYDAFRTGDGTTTLVVGDVAGHDSTAAAGMAQVRNVLRGVAQTLLGSPAAVLSALDAALARLQVTTLATAVVCQAWPGEDPDGPTVRLRWSNAGHPPPLVLHADGRCELLGRTPEALLGAGVIEGRRTDHEIELPPGAALILYTDGLVERRHQLLDDGIEQLRSAAEDLSGRPREDLADELLARLAGGREDDVVLVVASVEE